MRRMNGEDHMIENEWEVSLGVTAEWVANPLSTNTESGAKQSTKLFQRAGIYVCKAATSSATSQTSVLVHSTRAVSSREASQLVVK